MIRKGKSWENRCWELQRERLLDWEFTISGWWEGSWDLEINDIKRQLNYRIQSIDIRTSIYSHKQTWGTLKERQRDWVNKIEILRRTN